MEQNKENELRTFIDRLKKENITYGNFRRIFDDLITHKNTISIQVRNLHELYDRESQELQELLEQREIQSIMEDKNSNVPREVYEKKKKMEDYMSTINLWITLLVEMLNISVRKFATALEGVKDMDIEKEALNRFSEIQRREHEFHEQVIKNEINQMREALREFRREFNRLGFETQQYQKLIIAEYVSNEIIKKAMDFMREKYEPFYKKQKININEDDLFADDNKSQEEPKVSKKIEEEPDDDDDPDKYLVKKKKKGD